jgi:hypothetical protein
MRWQAVILRGNRQGARDAPHVGPCRQGGIKAKTEKACQMLVAVHTSGRTTTCQQPLTNIARRVIQSLPGAMVGCTAMEHAMLDNAYAEPSALAARMSLNTQYFVAHETGVAGIFEYLATEARSVKARAASSPAGKPGNCRRAFKTTQVCALNFTQGL